MRTIPQQRLSHEWLTKIILWLLLCFQSACAPITWLDEARSLSHLGQWEPALERYENILLTGSTHSQVYESSALIIDQLTNDQVQMLSTVMSKHRSAETCLSLLDLEGLHPHVYEHSDIIGLSTLHQSLKDPIFKASVSYIVSQLEVLQTCPLLRYNWSEASRLTHLFETQLITLTNRANNLESLSFLSNLLNALSQSPLALHNTASLNYALEKEWRDQWHTQILSSLESNHWALAWLFGEMANYSPIQRQFTFLNTPTWLSSKSPHDSELHQFINHELETAITVLSQEQVKILETSPSTHLSKFIKALDTSDPSKSTALSDTQSAYHKTYSHLTTTQPILINLTESEAKCVVSNIKDFHELRYLEREDQVTAPQYITTLKIVEKLQSQLEAAQSQREDLEHSLLNAQSALDKTTQYTLYAYQSDTDQLEEIEGSLKTEIKRFKAQRADLFSQSGPPSKEERIQLEKLTIKLSDLSTKLEQTKIDLEIALSALDDYQMKYSVKRQEVTRLSSYLAKITLTINHLSKKLDQKETLLTELPKTKVDQVFSVFRYPIVKKILKCTLTWSAHLSDDQTVKEPEELMWRFSTSSESVHVTHKPYMRYRISSKQFNQKVQTAQLLKSTRADLKQKFQAWLHRKRINLLVSKAQDLILEGKAQLSTESLALLTYLTPQPFLSTLLNRVHTRLQLEAPL